MRCEVRFAEEDAPTYRVRSGEEGTGVTLLELVLDLIYNPFQRFRMHCGQTYVAGGCGGAAMSNDGQRKAGGDSAE